METEINEIFLWIVIVIKDETTPSNKPHSWESEESFFFYLAITSSKTNSVLPLLVQAIQVSY